MCCGVFTGCSAGIPSYVLRPGGSGAYTRRFPSDLNPKPSPKPDFLSPEFGQIQYRALTRVRPNLLKGILIRIESNLVKSATPGIGALTRTRFSMTRHRS